MAIDVRPGEHRRVVDAVAYERHAAIALGSDPFENLHLILRQQLGVDLVDGQIRCDAPGHFGAVARQHHGPPDAEPPQASYGLRGVGLHFIGDRDRTRQPAVDGDMHHGSRPFRLDIRDAETAQQAGVSQSDRPAVDVGDHSLPGYFFVASDSVSPRVPIDA